MPLFQFTKAYYRDSKKYDTDIEMLFVNDDDNSLLVFDGHFFMLVNKGKTLNTQILPELDLSYLKLSKPFVSLVAIKTLTKMHRNEIYMLLESGVIKITYHFNTAQGEPIQEVL